MCPHTTIYVSSCRIYEHAVKIEALLRGHQTVLYASSASDYTTAYVRKPFCVLFCGYRYSDQSGRRARAGPGRHDRELHRMAAALSPHGSALSSRPHCFPLLRKRTYTRGSRAPAGTQFTQVLSLLKAGTQCTQCTQFTQGSGRYSVYLLS